MILFCYLQVITKFNPAIGDTHFRVDNFIVDILIEEILKNLKPRYYYLIRRYPTRS